MRTLVLFTAMTLLCIVGLSTICQAADFACPAGEVACLINAINAANTHGEEENSIHLAAGTYSLTAADNNTDGPNGLPSITSSLKLIGAGGDADTVIEGPGGFPEFRLMHVAGTGNVTLKRLTLRGGGFRRADFRGAGLFNDGGAVTIIDSTVTNNANSCCLGGGLYNAAGMVTIIDSTVTNNDAGSSGAGGGLYNADGVITLSNSILSGNRAGGVGGGGGGILNTGSVTIMDSTVANNHAAQVGGGILNGGTITIIRSSVSSNSSSDPGHGAGISNFGTLTIADSTISGNSGRVSGGIATSGTMMITNSTISGNHGSFNVGGIAAGGTVMITNSTISGNTSGVFGTGGIVGGTLQNTILALNFNNGGSRPPDCLGVTSLGHNLIGTTTGCNVTLQPGDLTGDPRLDTFSDDETPGNGHYPLLPTSQAIDAGNDEACPTRDQIGLKRHHPCDIGAIEFPKRR